MKFNKIIGFVVFETPKSCWDYNSLQFVMYDQLVADE